jgi:pantoate--beta-alanine ligase
MAGLQIIHEKDALSRALHALRAGGGEIAFVPTMGALHAGHMALVRAAKRHANHVVASIFVNPKQFGEGEDLDKYPRRLGEDADLLEAEGVELLWAPNAAVMYPEGHTSSVHVGGVSEPLEGACRPGHFDGVATIVAKLFNQVRPDVALFGEKDYQQLAVIRRMVVDLDIPVRIVGVPTEREADGLALSSRNVYLSESERISARALPRALAGAAEAIRAGKDIQEALQSARGELEAAGFDPVEYVELRDSEDLARLDRLDRPARLLAAARIGATRLIDNIPVAPAG